MKAPVITNNNELHALAVKPGELISIYLHAGIHCTACGSRHPCKEPVQVELSVDADGLPRIVIEAKHKALVSTFDEVYPGQATVLPTDRREGGT